MDKRRAKRQAVDLCGRLIQQYLDAGPDWLDAKVIDALETLRDEMWRRAPDGSFPPAPTQAPPDSVR